MVSFVWFILSLCKVCSFSWWPVFIEGIIVFLAFIINYSISNNYVTGIFAVFSVGVMAFAGLKLFCGLTISPWWILLAGIWLALALFFPGGLSLTYLWFDHLNIITFSKGQFIFLIVVDILFVFILVYYIINSIIEKRKNRFT